MHDIHREVHKLVAQGIVLLQELDDENGIGLIEKRRKGFGKANIIYVKSFMVYEGQGEQSAEETQKFTK